MAIPASNWLHLAALGAGGWGAYNISKGKGGVLQYIAAALGAWGLYRFSQHGWISTTSGAGQAQLTALQQQAAAQQAAQQQAAAAQQAAQGTYNAWSALGQGIGQLGAGIYGLATADSSPSSGSSGTTADYIPSGLDYNSLPYEAPPPGYGGA